MEEIEVKVDKRLELMGVLLNLSIYGEKFPMCLRECKSKTYYEDYKNQFLKYKTHPAITTLNEIISTLNFSYDAPPELFLQLDDNYNFIGQNKYPFVDRLEKSELVLKFFDEVKDFVKVSNFEEFFNSHAKLYQEEIEKFNTNINLKGVLPWLKNFYNQDLHEYTFKVYIAILAEGGGGYGFEEGCVDTSLQRTHQVSKVAISYYLHEFSHPIVNPLLDKYYSKVKKPNFTKQELDKLQETGYGDMFSIVVDAVIRAIELLYIKDTDPSCLERFYNKQENNGFPKIIIDAIAEKMEEYRKNPNRNFEDGFMEIANAIAEVQEKK